MTVTSEAPQLHSPPATLPAGGTDPERFDWAEAWYPVHYIEDLDKTRPTRFTLLVLGGRNDPSIYETKGLPV